MDEGHSRVKDAGSITFTFPMTLGAGVDKVDPAEDVTDADGAAATTVLHMYTVFWEAKRAKKRISMAPTKLNLK